MKWGKDGVETRPHVLYPDTMSWSYRCSYGKNVSVRIGGRGAMVIRLFIYEI